MKFEIVADTERTPTKRGGSDWDPVAEAIGKGKTVFVETSVSRQAVYVAMKKRFGKRSVSIVPKEGGFIIWKKEESSGSSK